MAIFNRFWDAPRILILLQAFGPYNGLRRPAGVQVSILSFPNKSATNPATLERGNGLVGLGWNLNEGPWSVVHATPSASPTAPSGESIFRRTPIFDRWILRRLRLLSEIEKHCGRLYPNINHRGASLWCRRFGHRPSHKNSRTKYGIEK